MLSKAGNWASASVGVPLLGNMCGRFLLGAFLLEEFLCGLWEISNMPCRRISLSIGALLGKQEGVRLLGFLREKKKYIWAPFLDPEAIKILSLWAVWNFSKGARLSWVDMRLWGTKSPTIRPRCVGPVRGSNPVLINQSISSSQWLLPDNTQHSQQTNIYAPVGFETSIPASQRPQTHGLDHATNGTGTQMSLVYKNRLLKQTSCSKCNGCFYSSNNFPLKFHRLYTSQQNNISTANRI